MTKRYLTTPIYYVNAAPHVGHAYTNLATDTLARFYRCVGDDVFFLTGTDEHGEKIEQAAREADTEPQVFVDEVVQTFQQLWSDLNLSHDGFIRTTEARHVRGVQEIFRTLYDQGDIYKDVYEGPYCVPCESYWTRDQLEDGNCPECGRAVEELSEESYFFRLTKYLPELLEHLEKHPSFVRPESRLNEVKSQVQSDEIEDLSVSRTRFDWGVPVPFDDEHVIYVWFDALINYLTGIGYPEGAYEEWWPADVHVIGKDILRFHAVIWPCMLLALDLDLPRRVHAHGWWTLEGEKISKSRGNVVDPRELADEYGRDALRFFLLRQIPFGEDGVLSDQALVETINGNLANDLGNLVSRVLSMVQQYRDGNLPLPGEGPPDEDLRTAAASTRKQYIELMQKLRFDRALKVMMEFVQRINGWIQNHKPWELSDRDEKQDRLDAILLELAQALNQVSYLIQPVMPETARSIWERLNHEPTQDLAETMQWNELDGGEPTSKGSALFPRMKTSH